MIRGNNNTYNTQRGVAAPSAKNKGTIA